MPSRRLVSLAARHLVAMLIAAPGWQGATAAPQPPQPAASQTQRAVVAYEAGAYDDALRDFADAARQGNRLAQFNYAMMLLRGEGTASQPQQALVWLRKAADNQMTHAQFTMGELHERGDLVPKSLEEANRWYERAGAGGHIQAQVALATNYFIGRGVPRDYGKAFDWYTRAATAGDGGAQYIVASYYERGEPGVVERDIEQAKIWYARAAARGDPGALAKLRSLLEQTVKSRRPTM
ncbi:Sel1 repeat-containing protein [Cupriavidus gilardii J11]|uniref:Sel1 repeat-containing protein n=1 Tax=Cupriavidus gilardii J11 TaxID=936133 RepID=A0A562BJ64_9BURK|nr:Sel1 repeat-containing protein [Cupriavidus gilardii J11]